MPSMIELLVKCIKGKECTKKENAVKEMLEEITFLRNWLCKSNKLSNNPTNTSTTFQTSIWVKLAEVG